MPESMPQFGALQGHTYMRLTTFRRSGAAVPTPVWFAEERGRLYFFTIAGAGKLKRIRHTPRVLVAPCDARGNVLGPEAAGRARLLPAEDSRWIEALLTRKYGLQKRLIDFFSLLWRRERVYIAVAPLDE